MQCKIHYWQLILVIKDLVELDNRRVQQLKILYEQLMAIHKPDVFKG